MFLRDDHARLADALKALRGRFIVTLNDLSETRALYAWAHVEPVTVNYRVSGGVNPAREIIVSR